MYYLLLVQVEELLVHAGDLHFNKAVSDLENGVGILSGNLDLSKDKILELSKKRAQLQDKIEHCMNRNQEIHEELSSKDDETVKELEEELGNLIEKKDIENIEKGRCGETIDRIGEEIFVINEKIGAIEDKEGIAKIAEERVVAVQKCTKALRQILEVETRDLRPLLDIKIGETFEKIMTKDYKAQLTDSFEMRITKTLKKENTNVETEVALSTGERTVAALVFIASLLALAKERENIETVVKELKSTSYPLVIDSPFGQLSTFRAGIARQLPHLAPQVIIFVSPSQFRGSVEETLKKSQKIGKQYYLHYHGPDLPDTSEKELLINDMSIQQYTKLDEGEYTKIEELKI